MSVPTRPLPDADRDKSVRMSLVVVLLAAALIYLPALFSPPFLLDDVDAVQAQIARNMLTSGDWVTARIDGVAYFEKSPLIYWLMGVSYRIFGVHDWAARIPIALSSIALAWLTFAFGARAFGRRAGYFAGLAMGTCIGLWLFTRILIPDCTLTVFTTLAIWAFLRVFDARETRPRLWAYVFAASLAMGLLLKSLVAVVFPVAGALLYLAFHRPLFRRRRGGGCIHSAALRFWSPSRRLGMFSPPFAIRRTSPGRSPARRDIITASCGFTSSMNSCCVF